MISRVDTAILLMLAAALLGAAADSDALGRSQEAFTRRDWVAAEREARTAVQEQPKNARAYRMLGIVFVAQQRFVEAVGPLDRACAIDPRDELNCYYSGRNAYAVGSYDRSQAVLESALKQFPRSERIRIGLGLTFEALGRAEEADRLLRTAVSSGSTNALSEYGQFLFRQGRLQESVAVLRRSGNQEALDRALRQQRYVSSGSGQGSAVPVQFAASELPVVVRNGAVGDKHLVETMIGGVAVFDYDGDGWPDIYVANGAPIPSLTKTDNSWHNRLFRNNHDGTFRDVTELAGVAGTGFSMGVAAADFDNDGWIDLLVTGVRSVTLYRNLGSGVFEDVTARSGLSAERQWTVSAGWFDYDNDGRLDLFLVRYVAWNPEAEQRCGSETARTYCHPRFYKPLANALFHNEGDGKFRDVSVESGIGGSLGKGMGVAFADYDHDGRTDIFVTNDTMPNFLFRNLGGGRFEEVAVSAGLAYNNDGRTTSAMGVDFQDYDNDGFDDLFITNLSNETFSFFRNTGSGAFADVGPVSRVAPASLRATGWSALMVDFNNDGRKDLFAAGGHVEDNVEQISSLQSRQPNLLFTQRGDGTFSSSELPGKAFHRGAAFGDFNRDGRMDLVITRLGERPAVLTNITDSKHHWLGIRLRGFKSNRDGIGARVQVITEAGSQWNQISTAVGYGSSSEAIAHFGVGNSSSVQQVEVIWPSGLRQSLTDVVADRYITIEEPH